MEKQLTQQIQIDIKRAIPLFADNVIVANLIKDSEKEKASKKKEGHVTLIFVDTLTKQAVARVVVSRQTAESLLKSLDESLKKFDKNLNEKTKEKSEPASSKTRYLG
jgi:hypothetical protein